MMIASRLLTLAEGNEKTEIPIRLFAPVKEHDGAWFCRYEIDWPDKMHTMNAGGVDAMQSLVIALQMIGANLYTSEYHHTGRLYFHELGEGYGFPVSANLRDLLQGSDAKYL
jgi:hypothetical protein